MGLFDWLRGKKTTPAAPVVASAEPENAGLGVPHAIPDEAERILRGLAPVDSVRRPPGRGALAFTVAGDEHVLHFHHLFGELRDSSPDAREERIASVLRVVLEKAKDEPWSDVSGRVLPVIRAGTYGAYLSEARELPPQPLRREVLPFLVEVLMEDRPEAMALITPRNLEHWAVPEEDVRRAADENAEALRDTTLEPYLERFGGISSLAESDDYATTRLLLPGWLASLSSRVPGRPLAIIPERTTLYVAGDADPAAAGWLAETAQREWRATTRAISPVVYTCDDSGAVVPYRRPESEPLGRLLRAGEELLLAKEYGEQQQLLEEMHERDGVDLFVATATLVERKDGCTRSYCVWTDGVESLLPRTDVLFVQSNPPSEPGGWRYFVPFQRARDLSGDAWSVAEVPAGPVRFRTRGPIDPGLRARLAREAIPLDQIP